MSPESENDYLKCEGRIRLLLGLLANCDIECDFGIRPSERDFWAEFPEFVNYRLDGYRMPDSAVPRFESIEVEQIVNDCVKHGWLAWTIDERGITISVTSGGEAARRGDVPPSIDMSDQDAAKLILNLLKRAKCERDGDLLGDPRLFQDGIESKNLRHWAMHFGLSSESYQEAFDLITTKGFAVERADRPGLAIVHITREGENKLGARKPRIKRDVAERLALEHLTRRPHDTGLQVAEALNCCESFVNTLRAWKETRPLRETQKRLRKKPKAVEQDVSVIDAGLSRSSQVRDQKAREYALDEEIDKREKELNRRIHEYENRHPTATAKETAKVVGCPPKVVKQRRIMLAKLVREQSNETRAEPVDQANPARLNLKRKEVFKRV